jgi:hypothetical protein
MTTSRSHVPSRRAAWFLAVLAAAPAAALAGNKDEVKAHIAKASQAHKDGRYADARVELEAAYALDPRPELLYALGQVDAKLGNCRDAINHFQRFAATQSDPQVTRVVDQAIAACKPEPEPAKPAPDRAPTGAPASPQPAERAPQAPAPVAAQRSPWYRDTVGDALVAGGAVAVVVGLVEYRSALSDLDAAGDRGSTTTLDRYHELVDSAHRKRTMSIVLAGAGSALIGAGIVRFVLHREPTEVRVGVAPAHGGGMVTYAGSF